MSEDPICVIPPEICVICGLLRSTSPGVRAATLTFPWPLPLPAEGGQVLKCIYGRVASASVQFAVEHG